MSISVTNEELERVAQVAHAAIRAHQIAHGQAPHPEWDAAEESMRASTREAVRGALVDPTPGAQHDRWLEERRAEGWSYGPERDEGRKKNPNMVDFDELPRFERQKDAIIIALTRALLTGDA